MASFLILAIALCLANLVSSEIAVNFPLNSQLPPVARVDEPFSYTFSPYTFRSDLPFTYSLEDAPKWLSIDSDAGRLYGTPEDDDVPAGDVVGQPIILIANDGTSQASLEATLVVSRNKPPTVKIPISEQIKNFGNYSAPSSLLLYPSTDFSYTFDPETFEHQPNMINYYAASADNTPLPAWMSFDAASLTFSGKTPPFESLVQPPQTFGFRLFASDIVGFSATDVSFTIVVGSRKLTADDPVITLNTTLGKKISYDGLAGAIKLDNEPVTPADLEVSTADMPKWLSLDSKTWKIEGKPGEGDRSTNFTINFRDSYSDTLNVQVIINVESSLFKKPLDDLDIKAGEDVNIDLEPYFWDSSDVDVEMTVDPEKDWLRLNGFNITGAVPKSASGELDITISASSKSSDLEESKSFNMALLAVSATATSSASMTSTEATNKPTQTSSIIEKDSSKSDSGGLTTGEILLATLLPILFVAILVMLLICCLIRRRRARSSYLSSKFRNKISGPVIESLRVNGSSPTMQEVHSASSVGLAAQRRGRQGYSEIGSQRSRFSSGSSITPELPLGYMAEDSRGQMVRTDSAETSEGRQSWVTVEGTEAATARRSEASIGSSGSDTTLPESTHQLIPPPPGFLSDAGGSSFRSGLDPAIPSLDDLSSLRQVDLQRSQTQTGSDLYSTTGGSSLAFPSSHQSSPRLITGLFGRRAPNVAAERQPRSRDVAGPYTAETAETAQRVPEMQRPSPARLSSQQEVSRRSSRAWYDTDSSSSGIRSFQSDPSFGSEENWRVVGTTRRAAPSMSYRELVDAAPFNPNRPSLAMSPGREGARPGERAGSPSSELISPSQWGDAKTSMRGSIVSRIDLLGKSGSGYSKLSDESAPRAPSMRSNLGESASGGWRREDSARTEGSFKAFL